MPLLHPGEARLARRFVPATKRCRLAFPPTAGSLQQRRQLDDPGLPLNHHLLSSPFVPPRPFPAGPTATPSDPRPSPGRQVCSGIATRTRNRRLRSLGATHPQHRLIRPPRWWTCLSDDFKEGGQEAGIVHIQVARSVRRLPIIILSRQRSRPML